MALRPICERFAHHIGIELITLLPSTILYYGDIHSPNSGEYSIFYAPSGNLTNLAGNGVYDELLNIVLGDTSEFSTTKNRHSLTSRVDIRGHWIADHLAQLERVQNDFSNRLRQAFRHYPKDTRFDPDHDYTSTFTNVSAPDLLRVLTCVYSPLNQKLTP